MLRSALLFAWLAAALLLSPAGASTPAGGRPVPGEPAGAPGPELALQLGHAAPVTCLAYSPDGRLLATGGEDRAVKLWNTRTGELRWTVRDPTGSASCLAFSPDGRVLAEGGWNPTLWDVAIGRHIVTDYTLGDSSATAMTFTRRGRYLAWGINFRLSLMAWRGEGKGVGSSIGDRKADFSLITVGCLADSGNVAIVTAHQLWLAYGEESPKAGQAFEDYCLIQDGRVGQRCAAGCPKPLSSADRIGAAAFSRDGRCLATLDGAGRLRLWVPAAGTLLRTLPRSEPSARCLALSPDGSLLACGAGREVRVWDTRSGEGVRTWTTEGEGVRALAFSPDGSTLAAASGSLVRLWGVRTGVAVGALTGPAGGEPALAFAPEGRILVSGGGRRRGAVQIWDRRTGELRRSLTGHEGWVYAVACSPDGETIASGGGAGEVLPGELRVWDARSGSLRWRQGWQPGDVRSLAYSPDGRVLASGSYRTAKLWDARAGTLVRPLEDATGDLPPGCAHAHVVTGLSFTPDGRLLATASADRTLKLWEPRTGALLRTLRGHQDWITAAAFSPDGKVLASCSWDATVRLWDPATGASLAVLEGPKHWLLSVAWSPDGETLAVACDDDTVLLWDVRSRRLRRTLTGHQDDVFSVAFSPDGALLASASADTTVNLWDGRTGRLRASLVSVSAANDTTALDSEGRPIGADGRPIGADGRPIGADGRPIGADARPIGADARPLEPQGKPRPGAEDFLVIVPGGYYVGSAAADRRVRFRLGRELFPAASFQACYYRPDRVARALAGEEPPPAQPLRGPRPPRVRITSPVSDARLTGERLRVTLEASDDSRVARVLLFIGGSRVEARALAGTSLAARSGSASRHAGSRRPLTAVRAPRPARTAPPGTQRFVAEAPLPTGQSRLLIQALAIDDDGLESAREEITVGASPAPSRPGRLLGLFVGISRYQDPRLRLQYAADDAAELARAWGEQHGLYAERRITTLPDEQATRERVGRALDDLVAGTTRADTVVLFLGGHGWRGDARTFYFATHETRRTDITHTALPWREVVRRLALLSARSKRVLVLLDACHSGSAATNEDLVRAVLGAGAGVMVFASSRGSEISRESPATGHGVFTQAVLEALRGQAAPPGERKLSLWDLEVYVRRRVKELTAGEQHPQVPFLQDFDTDAPIAAAPGE